MSGFRPLRWLKRRYLDLRILLRYRTLYPRFVLLADGEHEVSVNPRDPRARKKLIADSIRRKKRHNQIFWRAAVQDIEPDVALDIGVNFGECLFQASYSESTRAIGIDGNPDLLPFLTESRDRHAQSQQIEVHNAMVDESSREPATFYVSTQASGRSSAVKGVLVDRDCECRETTVPVTSIDAIVGSAAKRVVFKIDVEGYEGHVLRGMQKTLDTCEIAVGFIEFDTRMLSSAGEDLAALWRFLQDRFSVHMFVGKTLVPMMDCDWKTASELCEQEGSHTDLLLVRGETALARSFADRVFQSAAPAAA